MRSILTTKQKTASPCDWKTLADIEPRLQSVAMLASTGGDWHRWTQLKSTLEEYVGWNADNPKLRSTEAFNVASAHVLTIFERGVAG